MALSTYPSTHAALKTAVSLIRSGILFDAIELLDKHSMAAINQSGLSTKTWRESPTLFLKFSGPQATVRTQAEKAQEAADTYGKESFEISATKEEIDVLWSARKAVGPSLMAMKKDETDLFLSADAAVPISNLAIIMDEAQKAIVDAGLVGSTLGHVGDGVYLLSLDYITLGSTAMLTVLKGNFHTAIVCPASMREIAEKTMLFIQRRAVQLEGTITGEHGVGLNLRDLLPHELGDGAVDMMRRVSFRG